MQESEIWKLVQNWIAIKEHQQKQGFLEHIGSLNEQNRRLRPYNLELHCEKMNSRKESTYFIITPYLIQVYKGFVTEMNGELKIEDWEMQKQISCDSIKMPDIIGREKELTESFDLIAPLVKEESYILDGLTSGSLKYYQEKDEDGLYGRILETSHYIKIGPKKSHAKLNGKIEKIGTSEFQNIEELKLVQDGEEILPVLKKQSCESYFIAMEAMNKILESQVAKVYQLL